MKRIVMIFMILLAGSVFAASAQDGTIYGLISVDTAEVRAGPDFAFDTVGQLPLNTSVTIRGRAGDFYSSWDGRQWLQIDYGDRRAWIYARLVRTSKAFNSIPVTGIMPPRDANGRVPDVFDLSTDFCSGWQGDFTRSGDFMAGNSELIVTFPPLTGATLYSVIVITPAQFRIAFDTETTSAVIPLDQLPAQAGTYTWRVVPYWTTGTERYQWQQVCLLRTGGTFDKPETDSSVPNAFR